MCISDCHRSEEWNKVPKKERDKLGLKIEDDGEFWLVPVVQIRMCLAYGHTFCLEKQPSACMVLICM